MFYNGLENRKSLELDLSNCRTLEIYGFGRLLKQKVTKLLEMKIIDRTEIIQSINCLFKQCPIVGTKLAKLAMQF